MQDANARCGRLDRQCLWMSNRRRPQLKQEVNSKISRYVTFYIGFMKQIGTRENHFDILPKLSYGRAQDSSASKNVPSEGYCQISPSSLLVTLAERI